MFTSVRPPLCCWSPASTPGQPRSVNTALSYGSGTRQEARRQDAVTEIKVSPQVEKSHRAPRSMNGKRKGDREQEKHPKQNKQCVHLELGQLSTRASRPMGKGAAHKGLQDPRCSCPNSLQDPYCSCPSSPMAVGQVAPNWLRALPGSNRPVAGSLRERGDVAKEAARQPQRLRPPLHCTSAALLTTVAPGNHRITEW